MHPSHRLPFLLAALACCALPAHGQLRTWYVDAGVQGSPETGGSWQTAFLRLEDALRAAANSEDLREQIWVARGTYYPAPPPDPDPAPRPTTFLLPDGVLVFGGFLGNAEGGFETDRRQRNPEVNLTILSGDLARNDLIVDGVPFDFPNRPGDYADNAYHVVVFEPNPSFPIRLDGFIVRGGYADGEPSFHDQGAGILMAMTNPPDPEALDNLILNRLRVEYNYARFRGTGLAVGSKGDIVRISNCRFEHNFNLGVHETSLDIGGGAGIYTVFTNLHLQNTVFFDNHTTLGGGGGLLVKHVIGPDADGIIIANCSFHGNTASTSVGGGAIAEYPDYQGTAQDEVSIWNTIAWGDSAPELTPFQTTSVVNSDIQGSAYCSPPNTCLNPLFRNPVLGDLRLRPSSPAVNTGSYDLVQLDWPDIDEDQLDGSPDPERGGTEKMPWDLQKWHRIVATVDMGAFETCVGDLTDDGQVNIEDLAQMLGCFGLPLDCPNGTCCLADLDGNGEIGIQDLASLLSQFGTVCRIVESGLVGEGDGFTGGDDALNEWIRNATIDEIIRWWEAGMPPIGEW